MPTTPTGRPVWEGPPLMLHTELLTQSLCMLVDGVEIVRLEPLQRVLFVRDTNKKIEVFKKLTEAGANEMQVVKMIDTIMRAETYVPGYPSVVPEFPLRLDPSYRLVREGREIVTKYLREECATVPEPPRIRLGPRLRAFRRFTWILTKELFEDVGSM